MTQNLKLLFVLILLVLCVTCKKDKNTIHIRGTVYNPNQKTYVQGASVILQSSSVQAGVYNSAYQNIATGTTDASGKFSFDISVARVLGYKLIINKNNYFYSETDIGAETWSGGNTYNPVIDVFPVAYLKLIIQNAHPFDVNDVVYYNFTVPDSHLPSKNYCSGCCSDSLQTGNGMTYKATFKCITQGGTTTLVNWNYTKNNINRARDTNLYCTPLDTTTIKIQY